MDKGLLPCERTSHRRKIAVDDIIRYQRRRKAEQLAALEAIAVDPFEDDLSTSATEGLARRSVRNTGPVRRPANIRGNSRAVPVCHAMTSRAPPLRVTTAHRFAESRSGTSSISTSSARAEDPYSRCHSTRSRSGASDPRMSATRRPHSALPVSGGAGRARSRTNGSPVSQPWSRQYRTPTVARPTGR